MESKDMALADAFDISFTLKHDFVRMDCFNITLKMTTDSLSLFDVLTRSSCTTRNRLVIDIQRVKDAYSSFELNDVALIKSWFNIAYYLTKVIRKSALMKVLKWARSFLLFEQWINRSKNEEVSVVKMGKE